MMNTARREAVGRATRLAGNGLVLVKRRNKANDRFTPRPKGALQVTLHASPKAPTFGTALEKGMPFPADCVGMPHHLTWPIWDALHPKISH